MEIKQYGDKTNALVVFANDANRMVDAFGDVTKYILGNGTPADDTTGDPTQFVNTPVEAGAGTSTVVNSVVAGEKLTVTTAANEYDGVNFQLKGSQFEVDSTKPFQAYAKVKVQNATKCDLVFGLTSVDTAILAAAGHTVDLTGDGLFFFKAADSTTMSAEVYLDDAQTGTADYGTAIDTTATELFIDYNGSGVNFYVDGNLVGSFTGSLPDSVLTLSYVFRAGDDGAEVGTILDMSVIQLN